MKLSIPLLLLYNFSLFPQSNLPNYSLDMFSKDTAVISKYAVNIPVEKRAGLYALASYWRIEDRDGDRPDTISRNNHYSRNYRKKEIRESKKKYLNLKNKPNDWTVYYFLDLNQDSKLDIIEISSWSEDTVELYYPGILDNHIMFFLSTESKYYNKIYLPGRITSLSNINNEFHFTTISHSCCDEADVTRITKLHIPAKSSGIKVDQRFWANGENPDICNYGLGYEVHFNFPKHFDSVKYYQLREEFGTTQRIYGSRGRMRITSPKHELARVICETKNYYFIELKALKDEDGNVYSNNIYILEWVKKSDFEKSAVRLD